LQRPFRTEELKILRKGRSPQLNDSDSGDYLLGCFTYIFVIILFAVLGMALTEYMSLFWAAVLPFPIMGAVYFLYRVSESMLNTRTAGIALVDTVMATGLQITQEADKHKLTVQHASGELSWTGEINIMYVGSTEEDLRSTLQRKEIAFTHTEAGYQVSLAAISALHSDLLWIRFEPETQTSAYHFPLWSLSYYCRTEYNLIHSKQTGVLLFVGLISGTTEYFGADITFDSRHIKYVTYYE
jgi:hypothetical protein